MVPFTFPRLGISFAGLIMIAGIAATPAHAIYIEPPTLDEINETVQARLYSLKDHGIHSFQCQFQSEEINRALSEFSENEATMPSLKYGWVYDSQTRIELSGHWIEGIDEEHQEAAYAALKREIPWDLDFFLGFSVGSGPRGWGNSFGTEEHTDTPWNHDLLQRPRVVDGTLVYQFEDHAYLWIDPDRMQLIRMNGLIDDDPGSGELTVDFHYRSMDREYLLEKMEIAMDDENELRLKIDLTHDETDSVVTPSRSSFSIYNVGEGRWESVATILFRDIRMNQRIDTARFHVDGPDVISNSEELPKKMEPVALAVANTPLTVTVDDPKWHEVDSVGGQLEEFFDFILQYGPGFAYFAAVKSEEPMTPEDLVVNFYPNIEVENETRRELREAGAMRAIIIELNATVPGSPQPLDYLCVFASDGSTSVVIYAWAPVILSQAIGAIHDLVDSLSFDGISLAEKVRRKEAVLRPPGLDL